MVTMDCQRSSSSDGSSSGNSSSSINSANDNYAPFPCDSYTIKELNKIIKIFNKSIIPTTTQGGNKNKRIKLRGLKKTHKNK
jgi:hypothetical protein